MSDGGGEFTSKVFTTMLKDKGIEILQSIPYTHQQNGRAERIIRTSMEKAESMRLQACLPQSYWEFALDHATHVYNRTPMKRLKWQTPYQGVNGEKPSVDHLRVFGCAAYIFIPREVRENKMAPRSELMVYLGTHPGGKGWIFMCAPSNTVFSAAQATFNELFFPKCPISIVQWNTRLQSTVSAPKPCTKDGSCECPLPSWNDEEEFTQGHPRRAVPPPHVSPKGKEKALEPEVESQDPLPEVRQRTRTATKRPVPLPGGPRRSTRETRVPIKPGNVYGEGKHPVDIEKGIRKTRDWKKLVEERASRPGRVEDPIPGPSCLPQEEDHSSSEEEVRDSLEPTSEQEEEDNLIVRLCWEGGVGLQTFLLSKAVSPAATEKPLKEWTYRDIWSLPKEDQEEWRQACKQELEELHKRDVYDMVEHPCGHCQANVTFSSDNLSHREQTESMPQQYSDLRV